MLSADDDLTMAAPLRSAPAPTSSPAGTPASPDTWAFWKGRPAPAPEKVVRPWAGLADRLGLLMSRLEQGRARLADAGPRRPVLALRVAIEMIDELIAFPEGKGLGTHPSPEFLAVLSHLYDQAGRGRALVPVLSFSPFRILLRAARPAADEDAPRAAEALIRELPALVRSYFAALELPLPATTAGEWARVAELFAQELGEVTDKFAS